MNYLYYFYPGITILGIVSSYTDIKYKKIKNTHLAIALIYGILIYVYLFFNKQFPLNSLILSLNIGIASVLSLFLYFSHMWSAGDSKLFIVYAVLMPTQKYISLFTFPCIGLFLSIIIISFSVIILFMIKDLLLNPLPKLKLIFSKGTIIKLSESFAIIFSVTWPLWLFLYKIQRLSPLLKIILLYLTYFLLYSVLGKLKKKTYVFAIIIIAGIIIRLIVQPSAFSVEYLSTYTVKVIKYTFIFYLLRLLLFNEKPSNKSLIDERKILTARLPFAPFMFIGTLIANSNFIFWVMHLLNKLRR